MGDAIKHCMANLTNFDGRDTRSTFWYWVLVVVVATFILSMISGVVFAASSIGGAFTSASAGADEAQIEAEIMQSMSGGIVTQAWIGAGLSLLGLFLIIGTFVRRLRDAGLPVLLAVIPVLATLWGAYHSVSISGEMAALMAAGDIQGIETMSASSIGGSLISYIGYLVVIVGGLIPTRN